MRLDRPDPVVSDGEAVAPPRRPVVIELVGAPGAGKTTVLGAVQAGCAADGLHAATIVDAARTVAARTPIGKVAVRALPPRLRAKALWALFLAQRRISAAGFARRHRALIRSVRASQRERPAGAEADERRVLHWYIRMAGATTSWRRHAHDDEALIVDEGFAHRAVQLFTSVVEAPDAARIAAYVELIPRPDLLIHIRAPAEVCERRVLARGVWPRFEGRDPQELGRFIAHAHRATELVAEAAATDGWSVLAIENGERTPAEVAADVERVVAARLATDRNLAPATGNDPAPIALRVPRPGVALDRIRARLTSPGIDRASVEEILGRYGLRTTAAPRCLSVAWRNHLVWVPTTGGEKVLKRYRDMRATPAIVHEHSIAGRLAALDFPAVRVDATTDGATIVETRGARFASFDFERGSNLAGYWLPRGARLELWSRSGALLARFHRELEGFTPAGRHHLGFGSSGEAERDAAWHLTTLERLAGERPPAAESPLGRDWRWLTERAPRIAAPIAELDAALAAAPLSRTVVHGDFGIHNVLFRRDGTAVLLDLELAHVDRRLIDHVTVLSRADADAAQAFLRGYDLIHGARGEEWRYVPELWRSYRLCGAVQSWQNFVEFGGEARLRTARRRVIEAERIAAEGVPSWARVPG
jgi:Ser/Thr protein kinase RdoA (MazF antagonist)/thymidylate kinase